MKTHTDAVARLQTNASRRILLPEVVSFADLFTEARPWHFDAPRATHNASREVDGNEVGPYCSVDVDKRRWSLDVVASDAVIEAVRPRIVTPDDRLSFKVIEHPASGYALVICEHGYIIGSHWLAYIDPATIPGGGDA